MREIHEGLDGSGRLSLRERGERVKKTLQRIMPISSEHESALRDMMVNIVLNEEDICQLFPGKPLCGATELFLNRVISTEIDIAQTILDQLALIRKDRPTFLESLCGDLTEEEQHILQAAFLELPNNRASERLARYLNGELLQRIGIDHGTSRQAVGYSCVRLRHVLRSYDERMSGILERLTPQFPNHLKGSIVEGLIECLPYIDDELSRLAARQEQRLDDKAIAYLAWSLVNTSATAQEALLVITKLNAPKLTGLSDKNPLQKITINSRASFMQKYKAYHTFLKAFQYTGPKPTYETSDEATKLILQALAACMVSKPPIPSKDEVIEHAKDIEAGVFADSLLEQDESDWPVEATKEELCQIVKLGELAMYQLLKSHVRFAFSRTNRMLHQMESPREVDDVILVGMQGLLRAIRSYDYTTGYNLTSLAKVAIDRHVERHIIANDWRVTFGLGMRLASLRKYKINMTNELQKEPSSQAIAERMGISLAQVNELLIEETRVRNQMRIASDEELNKLASATESTNSFSTNTKVMLQAALKGQPLGYEILELHFARHYPIAEVAEILEKSPQDIQQRLKAALMALQSSIEPATLRDILKHD